MVFLPLKIYKTIKQSFFVYYYIIVVAILTFNILLFKVIGDLISNFFGTSIGPSMRIFATNGSDKCLMGLTLELLLETLNIKYYYILGTYTYF